MEEFGGQRTVCGKLARKGRLLAAALVLSVVLTACGGGDDSPAGVPTSSRDAEPGPGGSAIRPGGAPTSPGETLTNPGTTDPGSTDPGAPTSPGGELVDSGGAPTDDETAPPLAGEDVGPEAGAGTASVTLSWVPPTMNDDGSPLNLTGYRIYWGTSEDKFTNSVVLDNPGLTRYVVEQLTAGTWYFVATALSGDRESEYSNVFSMTVD